MSAAFTLTFEDDQLQAGLRAMRDVGMSPRPLLDDVGAKMEVATVLRFETNVAPDGTPWKPSLRAKVTGSKTLVMTTQLRDSISYVVEDDAVEVGSNAIYARIHQEGGVITAKDGGALRFELATGGFATVKSVTIPARAYLGVSAEDVDTIIAITGDHLAAAWNSAGAA